MKGLKVGETYLFSDDKVEWKERIFLHDLGKKCVSRYIVVHPYYEEAYKRGEQFQWSYHFYCCKPKCSEGE